VSGLWKISCEGTTPWAASLRHSQTIDLSPRRTGQGATSGADEDGGAGQTWPTSRMPGGMDPVTFSAELPSCPADRCRPIEMTTSYACGPLPLEIFVVSLADIGECLLY